MNQLAREEGIFCGVSGGATMASALKVAEKAPKGSVILAMVPDTAERYMSTPLFAEIEADMNDEEKAISTSTPIAQL
jgi:cysteine synthase A